MSLNEFVLAFVGVVIGLGVGDLLTSLHKLLRAGARVKWDWLTIAYAAMMLYALIVFWWWQFGYPRTETLTVAAFLLDFVFLAISFLMVASALPDDVPAEGIDLRAFYIASMRHRWSLITLSLSLNLTLMINDSGVSGDWSAWADWRSMLPIVSAILAALAIRVRAIWFQSLAIGWIIAVTSYFNLFRTIGP